MKCIIVDDEPLAIEILESYVSKIDQLEIAGTFRNAVSAFAFLQQHTIDLIFLDIQMPKLSGIDFLRTLKNPPKVILTTAFRDYALDGFELEVVDYLLAYTIRKIFKSCSQSIASNGSTRSYCHQNRNYICRQLCIL
jgi:DNA-binding LytR/AlgR family response regulator